MNHLISEMKSQIKVFCPEIHDIQIKVERDPDQWFTSSIHARAGGKIFHAVKRSPNYRKCLERSLQAILGQIRKVKDKRIKDRHKYADHVFLSA